MTDTEELLEKMRQWMLAEVEKAKKPYADSFVLTSLAFSASKVVGIADAEPALIRLHNVAGKYGLGTFDVVTPDEALGRIEYALMS
jgi:hypothetical protein